MPPVKRRLSAAEFEALRPLMNISDDRMEAARSVLVDNRTYEYVSKNYGWSRQCVGGAVNAVWSKYKSYQESQKLSANANLLLPDGWEQITLIAPSSLIPIIRNEVANVIENHDQIYKLEK